MSWGAQIRGVENLEPEMMAIVREGEQSGLEILGVKGADMVQANITEPFDGKPPAVCFGNLAGSIVSDFQPLGEEMREVIGVGASLGAEKYAAPVETGAVPHMPPVDALLLWVQKKFQVEDEKDARSIAFAVATSIKKKGTAGHFMFERALPDLEPLAVPTLESEIAAAFARHGFVGAGGL